MAKVRAIDVRMFSLKFNGEFIKIINQLRNIDINPARYNDSIQQVGKANPASGKPVILTKIVDRDYPNFYFQVELRVDPNHTPTLLCTYRPSSPETNSTGRFAIKSDIDIETHYGNWKGLNDSYDAANDLLNGDNESKYYKEFFAEMESNDSGDDSEPLPVETQEEYYQKLLVFTQVIETIDFVDVEEKKDVLEGLGVIVDNLGRFSKRQYNQAAAHIWAKVQKWGPKAKKYIIEAFAKELAKEGVQRAVSGIRDILQHIATSAQDQN